MAVQLRKKRVDVLPYRATLWSIVAVVAALTVLQYNPVTVDSELGQAEGTEYTADSSADIVVVVDYEAIRQSGDTFADRDFSAAWIDVMLREVGPVSVATPETLGEDLIETARAMVLTHSVSTEMPDVAIQRIRREVLDGATVLVERPEGRLRELFSADGEAGPREAHEITHAEGVGEETAHQLGQMPLVTEFVGSTAPREEARTLLSMDGAPAMYSVEFGDGAAITVDFDFGRQIVALQQGRPADDFTLPETSDGPPRTADLVADDELVGSDVPYVDLLTRFTVHQVLARHAAIPALWPYPGGDAGAVIFAHQDSRLGDGGSWMMEQEAKYGGSSTLLTTADAGLTTEGARTIEDYGGQVGLTWRLPHPSVTRYERIGIGRFQPVRRPVDLETQRAALHDALPRGAVTAARSLDGIWTTDWTKPLAALADRGIRADLSYETPSHRGYSFGTGRPFLALNNEGVPLNIREYPTVIPTGADEGPSANELLENSAEGDHQALTISTRPARFADYPDIEQFDAWLELFDAIRAHDHRIVTVAEYAGYQRVRRGTSLQSRFDENQPLPADLEIEGAEPGATADRLRVTVETRRRGMELTVPTRVGDAQFLVAVEGAERVGDDIIADRRETTEAELSGTPLRRIELERGYNTLEFYYD